MSVTNIQFAIDLSASTQYTLVYNGQRYNSVTAEYV